MDLPPHTQIQSQERRVLEKEQEAFILFICQCIDRHLDLFCILAIVNNTAMNKEIQIPFQDTDFISFEYIAMEFLDCTVVVFFFF